MNEYGFFTHQAGSYQERVHHIQLAYASYAALLALFESTSLLGIGTSGEGDQEKMPSSTADPVVGAEGGI